MFTVISQKNNLCRLHFFAFKHTFHHPKLYNNWIQRSHRLSNHYTCGGGNFNLSYLNCQEIFDEALDKGQNLIEIDFLLSKDEKVICSHQLEYIQGYSLNNRPTYQQFNSSILLDKYHPLTLEHIFEQLKSHKNAKIIFDSKENDKTKILSKIVENAKNNNFDIFDKMIVQIYSEKNYQNIKSDVNLSQFKEFWYTNYVSNLLPSTINAIFADKKDVSTYVMNKQFWLFFTQLGMKTNKHIAVHTINDMESVKFLEQKGVDLIFKDYF